MPEYRINLNNAPYRTKPNFIRTRMDPGQIQPGPYYGDRSRRSEAVVQSTTDKEWFQMQAKSKLYSDLRGVGEDAQNSSEVLAFLKKYRDLAAYSAKWIGAQLLRTKATIDGMASLTGLAPDQAMARVTSDNPDLIQLWSDQGDIYANLAQAADQAGKYIGMVQSGGVSPEIASFYQNALPIYQKMLSDASQQGQNLGADPVTIGVIVIVSLVLIYGLVKTLKETKSLEELQSEKDAAINRIQNNANYTPAQKAQLIAPLMKVDNFNPKAGILETVGWIAAIGVGLFLAKIFLVDTGVISSLGRGVGARVATGSRSPSSSETARERKEYYESELAAQRAERQIARLGSGGRARPRPRPRKSGGGKKKSKFQV